MSEDKSKNVELRVGLVVLSALVVLIAFVLVIGDFHFAKQYRLYVDFKFSGTLAAGAPVRISGIQIGRVEKITFIGLEAPTDGGERLQTRLTVKIDERSRAALPQGTEFFISTAGLLGEQYLEAVPGDRVGAPIPDESVMRGIDPPRTDLLIARLNTVLETFSHLLTDNRGLLEDLAKAATGLTRSMDEVLREKRSTISEGVDNLVAISREAKGITEKINQGMGSAEELRTTVKNLSAIVATLKNEMPDLTAKTKRTMDEAEKAIAAVNGALEDKDRLKRTFASVETLASNGVQITEDAKALTKKLRRGEGSVGALLGDEDIYDDLKELLRDVKQHPWKIIWRD
jgi:phospholipid/cholesterol/gamma-HCH transport system substrate-binding protein